MLIYRVVICAIVLQGTLSVRNSDAQSTLGTSYMTPGGVVNVYEVPRRDREDYYPTYEEAARRKEDGLSINSQELNALKRGPATPAPGSIDEAVLLRRQKAVLQNQTEADEERIKAKSAAKIEASKAVIESGSNAELRRMELKHELEMKQLKAEMEMKLELEKRKQSLRSNQPSGARVEIEIEDADSSGTKKQP